MPEPAIREAPKTSIPNREFISPQGWEPKEREFPSIFELSNLEERAESKNDNEDMTNLLDEQETISIWIPQESKEATRPEKVELRLDQQVVIDEIVQTIRLAETTKNESKAMLSVNIGGERVSIEIVKRRNQTKIRFESENPSVRRLLRNTKVNLKSAAEHAGLNLQRIEVR